MNGKAKLIDTAVRRRTKSIEASIFTRQVVIVSFSFHNTVDHSCNLKLHYTPTFSDDTITSYSNNNLSSSKTCSISFAPRTNNASTNPIIDQHFHHLIQPKKAEADHRCFSCSASISRKRSRSNISSPCRHRRKFSPAISTCITCQLTCEKEMCMWTIDCFID